MERELAWRIDKPVVCDKPFLILEMEKYIKYSIFHTYWMSPTDGLVGYIFSTIFSMHDVQNKML